MVDRECEAPERRVQAALSAAAVAGRVERVAANLEDVFVASTGFDGRNQGGTPQEDAPAAADVAEDEERSSPEEAEP